MTLEVILYDCLCEINGQNYDRSKLTNRNYDIKGDN